MKHYLHTNNSTYPRFFQIYCRLQKYKLLYDIWDNQNTRNPFQATAENNAISVY